MGTRAKVLALGIAATCLVTSCGSPPPPAPSAVITASPTSVCVGDELATTIHLDAKSSAPNLTLVYQRSDPNEPPLKYAWTFSGSHVVIDSGDEHSVALTLFITADRPLHVRLRVENGAGGVSEALTTIAVTPLDDAGKCPIPVTE